MLVDFCGFLMDFGGFLGILMDFGGSLVEFVGCL